MIEKIEHLNQKTKDFYKNHISTNQKLVDLCLYPLENIKRVSDKYRFSTKYGEVKVLFSNIVYSKAIPSIKSAVDKNEFFLNMVKENNTEVYNNCIILSVYTNMRDKMILKNKYGFLETKAQNLIAGNSISIRSATNKTQYFINQCKEIHGDRYDYSKFNFTSFKTKSIIICKKHGEFKVVPDSHINKNGCCPKCSKENAVGFYNKKRANSRKKEWINKEAVLYVLKFSSEKESFYKIGCTYKDKINSRISKLSKSKYNVEVIKLVNTNLYNAVIVEQNIIEEFSKYKYIPKYNFAGYTECLSINPIKYIK